MILVHAGAHIYTILPLAGAGGDVGLNVISGMTGKLLLDRSLAFLAEKERCLCDGGMSGKRSTRDFLGCDHLRSDVKQCARCICQSRWPSPCSASRIS